MAVGNIFGLGFLGLVFTRYKISISQKQYNVTQSIYFFPHARRNFLFIATSASLCIIIIEYTTTQNNCYWRLSRSTIARALMRRLRQTKSKLPKIWGCFSPPKHPLVYGHDWVVQSRREVNEVCLAAWGKGGHTHLHVTLTSFRRQGQGPGASWPAKLINAWVKVVQKWTVGCLFEEIRYCRLGNYRTKKINSRQKVLAVLIFPVIGQLRFTQNGCVPISICISDLASKYKQRYM